MHAFICRRIGKCFASLVKLDGAADCPKSQNLVFELTKPSTMRWDESYSNRNKGCAGHQISRPQAQIRIAFEMRGEKPGEAFNKNCFSS